MDSDNKRGTALHFLSSTPFVINVEIQCITLGHYPNQSH